MAEWYLLKIRNEAENRLNVTAVLNCFGRSNSLLRFTNSHRCLILIILSKRMVLYIGVIYQSDLYIGSFQDNDQLLFWYDGLTYPAMGTPVNHSGVSLSSS